MRSTLRKVAFGIPVVIHFVPLLYIPFHGAAVLGRWLGPRLGIACADPVSTWLIGAACIVVPSAAIWASYRIGATLDTERA